MAVSELFLQQDGQEVGPFPIDEIRAQLAAGTLADNTPAWREGMADWAPLGSVLSVTPPPIGTQIPLTVPPNPAAQTPIGPDCRFGSGRRSRRRLLKMVF